MVKGVFLISALGKVMVAHTEENTFSAHSFGSVLFLWGIKMGIKRVLITGSRDFTDYEPLKRYVDFCLSNIRKNNEIVIVSGGAKGADLLGEQYAKENGFLVERYLPRWQIYGKSAGVRRNRTMVEISDYIICFWDGKSKGTKSTIAFARKANKPLRVKNMSEHTLYARFNLSTN